ncbi:hypothetical protein H696_00241 [Fonticula alba]|uniref:SAYSvFN domain-containing protein n=1 Tax=Fonticula alba TaxID=691883 RepID=A0A058ZFD1_FONAL|nr:hypothetical protein H696_00241 [Fonticula alba]KCV72661.1 hypothetical protein H696_00241 [Fonticula alba]|eukprot:XP_009492362.1 hypothetical protein H696_00241 [Fonticula alba]
MDDPPGRSFRLDGRNSFYSRMAHQLGPSFFLIGGFWALGWAVFVHLDFGAPYFALSLILLLILFGGRRRSEQGPRRPGELSAYAAFNPGGERILGDRRPEEMVRQLVVG